jgi:hypothetical protein
VRPPPTPPPPPPTTHHPTHHLHLHHPPAPTPSECAHTAPNVCARRPAQQAPSHTHLFRPAPHTIFLCVHAGTTTGRRQSPPTPQPAHERANQPQAPHQAHHRHGGTTCITPWAGHSEVVQVRAGQTTHTTHTENCPSRTRSLYTIPPTLARSHASNAHDDTMQYLSSMRGCCVREASNATAPAPLLCWRTPNRHLTLSSTSHTFVQQTHTKHSLNQSCTRTPLGSPRAQHDQRDQVQLEAGRDGRRARPS